MMTFLMAKTQLQRNQSKKACFGTKEWSKNSGKCNGCDLRDDCGKIKGTKKSKTVL
jgi:hypothetical protein